MKNINIYNQYMYSYPHKKDYEEIDNKTIKKYLEKICNTDLTLYFHIPFCSTKCGYCNLFSVTDTSFVDEYVKAMCRQIKQYSEILKNKNVNIESIIFGGGTPFILSCNNFDDIFNALEKYFDINIEKIGFDIETSPKETDEEKLQYLIKKGVNRISIGIQSFHQNELKKIYRNHKVEDCKKALTYLSENKPKILNIDLIYGIQNQSIESLKKSMDEALKYNPEEIFLYPLYVREGTGLAGHEDIKDEEKHDLYLFASKYLKDMGYYQTSMRRFTKNISSDESNCGFSQTISFGCGGRSYVENLHFCEPYETGAKICNSIIQKYINKIDFTLDVKGYILNDEEQSRRFVIKNLGYYRGVSRREYFNYFGKDLYLSYKEIFDDFILKDFVEMDDEFIFLTEKGLSLSDYILPLFAYN